MQETVSTERLIGTASVRARGGRTLLPELRFDHVLMGAALLVTALLVIPPILMLARTSVTVGERPGREGILSWAAYLDILTSPGLVGLLSGTTVFALGSTLVGLVLGGGLAWCTERTNAPLKQLVYAGTFVSFAVPGILRTIGWIFLLGPNSGALNALTRNLTGGERILLDVFSMPALILVEGMVWIPLVFLMMSASFRSMDPALEEAAAMSGANLFQTLRHVTVRLALPALFSILLLTFIRSVQAFEVPLLLGVPGKVRILTTEVYLSVHGRLVPDYSYASAYGILLLGGLAILIAGYGRLTRHAARFATVTGKGFRPHVMDLGGWRWAATAFILFVIILQFLPVAYLVLASLIPSFGLDKPLLEQLTLANYQTILGNGEILLSLRNSIIIGLISATVVVLLAALIAWIMVRTRISGRALLDQLASLPLVVPGIVMGIAVLALYLRSPIPVYGTIWILVIAYVTTFLPYGLRYAHPGLLRLHPELEESAAMSGAGWLTTFSRIVVPLLLPALFAGWVFVFLISLRELAVAALLYTAQAPVVATTMLDLWENGNSNQVSAFGTVVAIFSIAFALLAYRLSQRWGIRL